MQEQTVQTVSGSGGILGLGAEAAQTLGTGLAIVAVTLLLVLAFLWGRSQGSRTALSVMTVVSLAVLGSGVYLLLSAPAQDDLAAEAAAMGHTPEEHAAMMAASSAAPASDAAGTTAMRTPVAGTVPAEPVAVEALALLSDRELYQVFCQNCHGETGTGDGPLAAMLAIRPANIQEHLTHHPEEELIGLVVNGIPPAMPAQPFGEAEAARIIAWLRSVAPQEMPAMDHSQH